MSDNRKFFDYSDAVTARLIELKERSYCFNCTKKLHIYDMALIVDSRSPFRHMMHRTFCLDCQASAIKYMGERIRLKISDFNNVLGEVQP